MTFYLDLEAYWFAVGTICVSLAGFWGLKRVKALLSGR